MKIRLALFIVVTLAAAGCGGPAGSTMPATVAVELRPAVAVDASELDAAAAVLAARVAAMGLDIAVRTTPETIVLDVRSDLAVPTIIAPLIVPGRVWFAAVPPAVEPPAAGDAVNPAWGVLVGEEGIDRAATAVGDGGSIEIALLSDPADAFATWTASHVGQTFVIALDGKVLAAPMVQEGISGGRISIQSGEDTLVSTEARRIVALIASGPLPLELRP